MTHRYTLLVGGTVLSGRDEPDRSAIGWAEDTIIALGSDDQVRGISRGDSHEIDLRGACVVPLGEGPDVPWPSGGTLEIGGPADLAVVEVDPRVGGTGERRLSPVLIVRAGRVVAGTLPGAGSLSRHPDEHHHP